MFSDFLLSSTEFFWLGVKELFFKKNFDFIVWVILLCAISPFIVENVFLHNLQISPPFPVHLSVWLTKCFLREKFLSQCLHANPLSFKVIYTNFFSKWFCLWTWFRCVTYSSNPTKVYSICHSKCCKRLG